MKHTLNIKIEDVIRDMLYMFECVVIPNFGGFVSHYQSAKILRDKNLIIPPSKSLTFNTLLTKNDGLLAQEITAKYKVTYQEAIRIIDLEVDRWSEVLSTSGKITITGVGTISKNKKGSILFVQDFTDNLSNNAYGLGIIKAQVIKKDGISGKIKEEFVQRQTSPVYSQKLRKVVIGGSMAAVFLVLFAWSFMNFDEVQNRVESLSLFFTSENQDRKNKVDKESKVNIHESEGLNKLTKTVENEEVVVLENANSVSTELLHEIDSILSVEVEENEDIIDLTSHIETKIDKTKVDTESTESGNQDLYTGNYIVVAGCFRSSRNAINFVKELKSLGYEAHLSGYSTKGLHRVAYGSYESRFDALKSMKWIQSTHNAQAWMTTK